MSIQKLFIDSIIDGAIELQDVSLNEELVSELKKVDSALWDIVTASEFVENENGR